MLLVSSAGPADLGRVGSGFSDRPCHKQVRWQLERKTLMDLWRWVCEVIVQPHPGPFTHEPPLPSTPKGFLSLILEEYKCSRRNDPLHSLVLVHDISYSQSWIVFFSQNFVLILLSEMYLLRSQVFLRERDLSQITLKRNHQV